MGDESLCRLCAESRPFDDLIGIKDESGLNLNLEYKIYQCFQLKIDESDNLPQCICSKCCEKLNSVWEFNERVQRAQERLRAAVSIKPDSETENDFGYKFNSHNSENESETEDFVECLLSDSENQIEKNQTCSLEETKEIAENNITLNNLENSANPLSVNTENLNITEGKSARVKVRKKKRKVEEIQTECENEEESESESQCELSGISDAEINEDGSVILQQPKEGWDSYPWICAECGDQLSSATDLREHYSSAHNQSVLYVCVECSKQYTKYYGFLSHVRTHRTHLKYCCDVCGKFFSERKFLRKHRLIHSDTKPHVCSTCGKAFRTQSALYVHGRSHLPEDVKNKYPCDLCPKKFGTKPNLMAHKRIHTGIRDYTCDQCGKSFVQKGNLDNHLLTHTAARPFACEVCSKSFKTLMRLKKHESVHSGLKPYQCDVCGRQFRERGTLKEHHRIHTGAMPFTCEFCGKCFRFKGVLTTHRRQHTGERPYSCLECQHHFTNWPNYNKHMKRRHGINTSVTVRKPQLIPPTGMPYRNPPRTVVVPVLDSNTVNSTINTVGTASNDSIETNAIDIGAITQQQQQLTQHMLVIQDTSSMQSSVGYSEADQTYLGAVNVATAQLASGATIGALRTDRTSSVVGTTMLGVQGSQGYYVPGVLSLYNIQTVDPTQLIQPR